MSNKMIMMKDLVFKKAVTKWLRTTYSLFMPYKEHESFRTDKEVSEQLWTLLDRKRRQLMIVVAGHGYPRTYVPSDLKKNKREYQTLTLVADQFMFDLKLERVAAEKRKDKEFVFCNLSWDTDLVAFNAIVALAKVYTVDEWFLVNEEGEGK